MATDKDLITEIENSAPLKSFREELANEVSFRAPNSIKFNPMLIMMAISIIVQIIIAWRRNHSDDTVVGWLRNARTLSRWRVLTLRRRLDGLWQDVCDGKNCDDNLLFDAMLDKLENLSDESLAEIMRLAKEKGAE